MSGRWPSALFLPLLALALVACGDDSGTGSMPDMEVDMTDVDMTPEAVPVCDPTAIRELTSTGAVGETVTIDLDTSMVNTNPRDLAGCGAAGDASGQAAVSYVVPGTGELALIVSTQGGVTAGGLDTVVQVRTDSCESPAGTCIESAGGAQAEGAAIVQGGDTVHFIVTANGDEGPITLRVSPQVPTRPVLTELVAVDFAPQDGGGGDFFRITTTGSDEATDIVGIEFEALDASGNPIAIFGGGQTRGQFNFANPPGANPFTDTIQLTPALTTVSMAAAVQIRARLVDALGITSEPLTVDVQRGSFARLGEACEENTTLCLSDGTECAEGEGGAFTCVPTVVLERLCREADDVNAIDLSGLTPTTGVAPEPVAVTIPDPTAGLGAATSPCITAIGDGLEVLTAGAERGFLVDLPAGPLAYDVTVETDLPDNAAPSMNEFIAIYARRDCISDAPNDLACFDDITNDMGQLDPAGQRPSLTFEGVTPGPLYIFIEPLLLQPIGAPAGTDVGLDINAQFTVIPVITTGTACDPNGVLNRCAIAACPMTGEPVCP